MTEGTKIGLEIRAARIAVGLTQEIVANDLDISLSYYGHITEHALTGAVTQAVSRLLSRPTIYHPARTRRCLTIV